MVMINVRIRQSMVGNFESLTMYRILIRGSALVLVVVALAGCGGDADDSGASPADQEPAWNHDPADTELGPKVWGEIDEFERCRTGDQQSPVDISGAVRADLPPLEFEYPSTPFSVENTGHTIEASVPEGSNLTLTVGEDVYRLVRFHIHAPSEHTVDGDSYPAELHLVHESEAGELAVVAIFVENSSLPAPLIDEVIETAGDVGEEVQIQDALSPLDLLLDFEPPRATEKRYYTYTGSLTTPGCDEGVRWFVLQDIHIIDEGTVGLLHELIGDFPDYDGYANNNRPTQPLAGRTIQRSG
jgi:carbonic anhydrase